MTLCRIIFSIAAGWLTVGVSSADERRAFLQQYCLECHSSDAPDGGLDLSRLTYDLHNPVLFEKWVRIHDRIAAGEMPPKAESDIRDHTASARS